MVIQHPYDFHTHPYLTCYNLSFNPKFHFPALAFIWVLWVWLVITTTPPWALHGYAGWWQGCSLTLSLPVGGIGPLIHCRPQDPYPGSVTSPCTRRHLRSWYITCAVDRATSWSSPGLRALRTWSLPGECSWGPVTLMWQGGSSLTGDVTSCGLFIYHKTCIQGSREPCSIFSPESPLYVYWDRPWPLCYLFEETLISSPSDPVLQLEGSAVWSQKLMQYSSRKYRLPGPTKACQVRDSGQGLEICIVDSTLSTLFPLRVSWHHLESEHPVLHSGLGCLGPVFSLASPMPNPLCLAFEAESAPANRKEMSWGLSNCSCTLQFRGPEHSYVRTTKTAQGSDPRLPHTLASPFSEPQFSHL